MYRHPDVPGGTERLIEMATLVDETTRRVARLGGAAAMIAAFLRAVGSFVPAAPETTALAALTSRPTCLFCWASWVGT